MRKITVNKRVPPINAWVKTTTNELGKSSHRYGRIVNVLNKDGDVSLEVLWSDNRTKSTVNLNQVSCGFLENMEVQEVPCSKTQTTSGAGVVVGTRSIGHQEQVLVDFLELGERYWLPYENLRQIKGPIHRFMVCDKGPKDSAERFRLKTLAYALELWNENTGALSHLDIDPLPHQIHLVHRILSSGDLNWLIADDVGLGKTIETGMLIAALKQRGFLNRILLVTPAGLTHQWKEELQTKFKLNGFRIYGEDFQINDASHWKMYDYVIASVDRLKDEAQLVKLSQSGIWDLIIFDEAHRLSRRQYGRQIEASQRFKLAATLRQRTDSLILLSATPHQGMQDKFQALLELLHPERKKEISKLMLNPEIIGDMVFRNNKADVTDVDGNFVFKGKHITSIQVKASKQVSDFDKSLQEYVKKGYEAGKQLGVKGNAIGFVMTVYRKLFASSVAAITNALNNRKNRLLDELSQTQNSVAQERYSGEWEESYHSDSKEFFEGELELLETLISKANSLENYDEKLKYFVSKLIPEIQKDNETGKVLIFTEYRSTQNYLKTALENKFGSGCVRLINGSMTHQERLHSIFDFEQNVSFLISTEAGGEGINLQNHCYILVNYDLPWNPMRLVQRIGRLYRYGQKRPVVVFNMHTIETMDEHIVSMMYDKINQVVDDMAQISPEFNAQLSDDILGEISDFVDVSNILEQAAMTDVDRTEERINEALERAREAADKQRELFDYASSFDPNEIKRDLAISQEHVIAFVQGMFKKLNIEVIEKTHNNKLWQIRLPDHMLDNLSITKARYAVTLDRYLAKHRPDTHMLDLNSFIMRYLIAVAKDYRFYGQTAVIKNLGSDNNVILTSILRWQNNKGQRRRQEFAVFAINEDNQASLNTQSFIQWLKYPASNGDAIIHKSANRYAFEAAQTAANARLAQMSNMQLIPENHQWVGAAWLE